MTSARAAALRAHAGLACAVVPFAIAVHLLAEGLAIDAAAALPAFFLRHLYLLAPLACSLWIFGMTVGVGEDRAEITRRCALLRRQLRGLGTTANIGIFVSANLGFFGVTQALEGVPIASGSLPIALGCAVLGALLSAAVFFIWGTAIGRAALAAIVCALRALAPVERPERFPAVSTRCASAVFSLFAPNRPPPSPSFF